MHDVSQTIFCRCRQIFMPNFLQGIENAYQPTQSASHHQQQSQTHQSYGNLANQQVHYHNSQHSPPNNALHGSHGNLTNLGNVSQIRD